MSRSRAGSSVVEAVVATALAGIAVAGLAATAAMTVDGLRLARDSGTALALASERLEALRVGSREGRGAPTRLSVQVGWGWRSITLATEALP